MGVTKSRDAWHKVYGNHIIMDIMTSGRYGKLREFLHFANNDCMKPLGQYGHDRLFKIRPIIDMLRISFKQIPMEEFLSVDEQICPTKARSFLNQYMP